VLHIYNKKLKVTASIIGIGVIVAMMIPGGDFSKKNKPTGFLGPGEGGTGFLDAGWWYLQ